MRNSKKLNTTLSFSDRHWKIILHWIFLVTGLFSLLWFLVRVIPKPSRAAYPCMRVAAPMASSFVVWLIGIGSAAVVLRNAKQKLRTSKFAISAFSFGLALIIGTLGFLGADRLPLSAYIPTNTTYETTPDPVNDPIGVPKGLHPGRVVWVHCPDATDWEGPASGESCWEPEHSDQDKVDSMMSRVVRELAGKQTEAEAWDVLFRFFNQEHGKGNIGYQAGEKIAIKINLTTSNASSTANKATRKKTTYLDKAGDTLPPMILALLRQLVYVVGVAQPDISVGDPLAFFMDPWYISLASEFPNIQYLDHYSFSGRVQVQHSATPFYWSTSDAGSKLTDYLPVSFAEADYIINFAVLKGHSAGITVCAKNHYGSLIRNPVGFEWNVQKNYYDLHESLPNAAWSPGRGHYRALVDLMGHKELGAKTFLYLIDGLYGGYYWEGTPYQWNMPPFNGDWPSSLFASQDPVAIDSVAYDFLHTEWPNVVEGGSGSPGSLEGGAQDYLHEAALADNPPSGTFYDPENDGSAMDSLGVHEHWNNAVYKKYSRNLGINKGIELISVCEVSFVDIPSNYWAEAAISKIYCAGITTGCSQNPLKYCPENPVIRTQMAVFLGRAIHGSGFTPPSASGIFSDVPVSYWAADWIEQFYNDGITSGCGTNPLRYCPYNNVTRAQMAIFLLRSKHGSSYTPPSASGIFSDVPVTHWAADWIEQLYNEGITTGCGTGPLRYCPENSVTRAQMAVFIMRTFGL